MASKKRNAYLDDYKKVASGEYIYEGKWLRFLGTEEELKKKRNLLYILTIFGFIISLISGILPVPGALDKAYIILPYCLEIILLGMGVYKEIRLFKCGLKIKEHVYEKTYMEFKSIFIVALIGSSISLIGEIIYSILNGITFLVYVYILCKIICIIISYINIRITKEIKYEVIN